MQVSRSPTARWTSAAATAESTPPDRAQMTSPSEPVAAAWASTRVRISATVDSMKLAGVQVGAAPAMPTHEVAQDVPAARRVDDLGVELDAVEVPLRVGQAGERRSSRSGRSSGSRPAAG